MAVLGWIRNAVMSAVRWITGGRQLTVTTRPFWQPLDWPPIEQRQDIIERADTIILGQEQFPLQAPEAPLSDIYEGTAYGVTDAGTGPLETDEATVFGKAVYTTPTGGTVYRSIRVKVAWDMPIEDVIAAIDAAVAAVGRKYGLEEGEIVPGEDYYL